MKESANERRERSIAEKVKKDQILLESMSNIIASSEVIMSSLSKIQNSGSPIYRQRYKQQTKSYRKECVNTLNNYYDMMETGGVSDLFLSETKSKAMIYNQIQELDMDQTLAVGNFMSKLLNPVKKEEVLPVEEMSEDLHKHLPAEETPEHKEEIARMKEVIEAPKEEVLETIEEVEVKEPADSGDMSMEELEELYYSDNATNEDNPLDEVLNKSKVKEEEEYKPVVETEIAVSKSDFEKIQNGHANDGVMEEDILKKSLDSVATRGGIDTDLYAFSKGEQKEGVIVFKFKLK